MPYYSGQGKILLAKRDALEHPLTMRYIGKTANGAKIGLATTTQTRKEAESGQRLVAAGYIIEKNATLEFEVEDFAQDNLAFALWGTSSETAADTVAAETLPDDLVVGDLVDVAQFADITLDDLRRMSSLDTDAIDALAPSELWQVVQAMREVNADFFDMRGRVIRAGANQPDPLMAA